LTQKSNNLILNLAHSSLSYKIQIIELILLLTMIGDFIVNEEHETIHSNFDKLIFEYLKLNLGNV